MDNVDGLLGKHPGKLLNVPGDRLRVSQPAVDGNDRGESGKEPEEKKERHSGGNQRQVVGLYLGDGALQDLSPAACGNFLWGIGAMAEILASIETTLFGLLGIIGHGL